MLIKKPLKHLIKIVIYGFFISLIMQKLIVPEIKRLVDNYTIKRKKEKRRFDSMLLKNLNPLKGK
jgi:hypothetical protein